jgi:5-methylcytosine-specific restriction protein B
VKKEAMKEDKASEVRAVFERFLATRNEDWLATYSAAATWAQHASESEFRSPDFQRRLWEIDGVSGIGPGDSVTVPGAYTDTQIIDGLWSVRSGAKSDESLARAKTLDSEFWQILALVSPKHNPRRPIARLTRIFVVLRPRDMLCLMDHHRTRQFRQWLGEPAHKLSFIGQHAMLRQSLREILGAETKLEDDVLRSQFSWFVWDHILAPPEGEASAIEQVDEPKATDRPRVAILPAKAQSKGFSYLTNNLGLLLSMVRAAENGIDRESLDRQISEDAPALSRGSRSNLMSQASRLGLLSFQSGTYRPTAAGSALLEGEPPGEVITPVMIRNVFGPAQILDDLSREGTLTRSAIAQTCRRYYPRWTTDFAPNQLVAWMMDLGLVTIEGKGALARVNLTESGEYWRSGLPDNVKIPALLLTEEQPNPVEEEDTTVATALVEPMQAPELMQILKKFHEDVELSKLVFSDTQIGLVHAALHAARGKRFVLLAGLSGTGKTSMARGYARAYCDVLNLQTSMHYEQVAVWPDWTDPTGLLGFVNPLASTVVFQETPVLRLQLSAAENPDKPYFLCLDEMNLARVEHYFAPFLSAMEGQKGRLVIHAGRDPVDAIPPAIEWPENLFIVGTVNMDESTYPFSDKVLDRAFTFEFWEVDLHGWRATSQRMGCPEDVLDLVFEVLTALSAALAPARRHFGYRTCDEVLGFVRASPAVDRIAAIDTAVLAKVLPKVRGESGGALPKAIDNAIAVAETHHLSLTLAKLTQMKATLEEIGVVRFWA